MSWDSWDDDEPRSRRRRGFDADAMRHDAPPQSGAVTGAGVVTIIMGVSFLLCGGGFGLCGLFCTGAGMAVRQQGNLFPPDFFETAGGILLGWALVHLLLGVGLLIGGIVTLQRRNWGRNLTLVLAGIVASLGLAQIVLFVLIGTGEVGAMFGNADPNERIGQAVMGSFVALLYIAYAIFVYIVLLNSHNREEFD